MEAVAGGSDFVSIRARLSELEGQERELKADAVMLEASLNRDREPYTLDDVRRWFTNIRELLRVGAPEERKVVMRGLARKVEALDKETARVTFNVLPAPVVANQNHSSSYLHQWLAYDNRAQTMRTDARLPPRFTKGFDPVLWFPVA